MALIGVYLAALAVSLVLLVASARAAAPVLIAEIDVPAPPQEVWAAWSSIEGLATFFVQHGKIGSRPGDPYEIWFLPDAPAGGRGSEGTRLVAADPGKLISFEWAMPPYMESVRPHLTMVTINFEPDGAGNTHVTLVHSGFGPGEDWAKALDYFKDSWGLILSNLKYRFENGPIDWADYSKRYEQEKSLPWWRFDLVRQPD